MFKASTAVLIEVNNATYVNPETRQHFITQCQSGVKIKKYINDSKEWKYLRHLIKYFNQTTLSFHQQPEEPDDV